MALMLSVGARALLCAEEGGVRAAGGDAGTCPAAGVAASGRSEKRALSRELGSAEDRRAPWV